MAKHFDAPRALYRWQLGLIAASLPRRLIPRTPRERQAAINGRRTPESGPIPLRRPASTRAELPLPGPPVASRSGRPIPCAVGRAPRPL